MAHFVPGDLVDGRFRIASLIGGGSMAMVYFAVDTHADAPCAVKFLEDRYLRSTAQLRRFRAEADILARVKHPNMLAGVHTGLDYGLPYLATEYADGGSLANHLSEYGPLPPRQAVSAAIDVCAATFAAHRQGILHRNINPGNVLICEGNIVLSDLGLVKMSGPAHTKVRGSLDDLGFVAPEQRMDARYASVQADIYSIGATLFFLLRGAVPLSLYANDPREVYGDMAAELVHIIARATQWRADDRHHSVDEVEQELRQALETLPLDPFDAIALNPTEPVAAKNTGNRPETPDPCPERSNRPVAVVPELMWRPLG